MAQATEATLAIEYASVLQAFGFSRSDLGGPHDGEGDLSPTAIAKDLRTSSVGDVDDLYDHLRTAIARSHRGIEAPRHYWNRLPAVQLSEVFEPLGYEVGLREADEGFEVALRGDDATGTRRMTFTYPDREYGTDTYPALIRAVETRLLPEPDLQFVRLADRSVDDPWRFVLVAEDQLARLQEHFGPQVEVFDRPLLADRQPSAFEFGTGSDGGSEETVTIQVPDALDDAFRSVEREALKTATNGPRSEDDADEDIEMVDRILRNDRVSAD